MKNELTGKKIAILVEDGFEQVELTGPRQALDAAGAKTQVVSPKEGKVQGMNHDKAGDKIAVDVVLGKAVAADYDGLVLPWAA